MPDYVCQNPPNYKSWGNFTVYKLQIKSSNRKDVYFCLSNEQGFIKTEWPYFDECMEKYAHLYTTDGNVICITILKTMQQYLSDALIILSFKLSESNSGNLLQRNN